MAGLGIFLYPNISRIYARFSQYQIIMAYERQQENMGEELKKIEMEKLQQYNDALVDNDIAYEDPFEENEKNASVSSKKENERLGEPIGYIAIPKISINIPIYYGTTDYILQRGIGLLEKSSMPVGGKSTHAALTGHRGLPESKLFSDLDKMEIGDIFYIHSVAGTLAYEVENIETVLPNETESLKIQNNRDLVTLITCTPYMINTHRILVMGSRIPFVVEEEPRLLTPTERIISSVEESNPIIVVIMGLLLMGGVIFFVFISRKKKKDGDRA